MGLRFRKSFRLFRGFRVNLSKTGISESIGESPFTVNLRGDRVRETASLPGTGLSYSTQARRGRMAAGAILVVIAIAVLVLILR